MGMDGGDLTYLRVELVHFFAEKAELLVKLAALEEPGIGRVHVRDQSFSLAL
jgi:hypothetical protein